MLSSPLVLCRHGRLLVRLRAQVWHEYRDNESMNYQWINELPR